MVVNPFFFFSHSSIDHRPEEGIFDLSIKGAYYNRDNGHYKCEMLEAGTGATLKYESILLTVLLKPSAPKITQSSSAATEGRPYNLTCSSIGGSPAPAVNWYKEGQFKILESVNEIGRTKDDPTMATLVIQPTKEEDGSKYSCKVWNKAMGSDNNPLETSAQVFVNCEYD